MGKKLDVKPGDKFGKRTVLEECLEKRGGKTVYQTKCDCGLEQKIVGTSLKISKMCYRCNFNSKTLNVNIGDKFGSWTILEFSGKNKLGERLFTCKCSCGMQTKVRVDNLVYKKSTKCRFCVNKSRKFKHDTGKYIGQTFGKWTITEFKHFKKSNNGRTRTRAFYKATCKCGNVRISDIHGIRYSPNSCRKCKWGYYDKNTYSTWAGMKQRCTNPKYRHWKNYGGRGIKVCESWLKFSNFLRDMGERPEGLSLDRINNDGNYDPSNCRWTTRSVQLQNTRRNSKYKDKWTSVVIPKLEYLEFQNYLKKKKSKLNTTRYVHQQSIF